MIPYNVEPPKYLVVLVCFLLAGCGSKLPSVGGMVTLDGEPLKHGKVIFHSSEHAQGVGEIQSNGNYRVKTGASRGLAPGIYQVTVAAFYTKPASNDMEEPIPVLLTPAKYNSVETSGFQVEIVPGSNRCDFELTGK